jgi:DNA-3-methyladenine glycosylase II
VVRPATFQSLILFILEQQVSLASAYAAFKKLKQRIGFVTPAKILSLSDEELRTCYLQPAKNCLRKRTGKCYSEEAITVKSICIINMKMKFAWNLKK